MTRILVLKIKLAKSVRYSHTPAHKLKVYVQIIHIKLQADSHLFSMERYRGKCFYSSLVS